VAEAHSAAEAGVPERVPEVGVALRPRSWRLPRHRLSTRQPLEVVMRAELVLPVVQVKAERVPEAVVAATLPR